MSAAQPGPSHPTYLPLEPAGVQAARLQQGRQLLAVPNQQGVPLGTPFLRGGQPRAAGWAAN